ncbi:MAG: type II toxin-antitoxin system HicA family toxin [Acidimicrobiales bacterium]
MRSTAAITHEGEWYVARDLEVEVTSQGHSIDEAQAGAPRGHRAADHRHLPAFCVSPTLPVVSVAALAKVGYEQVSQQGSHVKLRRGERTVIVPAAS